MTMADLMLVLGVSMCSNGGVLPFFLGVMCLGIAVGWALGGWSR